MVLASGSSGGQNMAGSGSFVHRSSLISSGDPSPCLLTNRCERNEDLILREVVPNHEEGLMQFVLVIYNGSGHGLEEEKAMSTTPPSTI